MASLALVAAPVARAIELDRPAPDESNVPKEAAVATFGAGCFWCVEEVFHHADGVYAVISGYMGGTAADANYKKVCTGTTDHAEVVQIFFDPKKTSFEKLVELFWKQHDPTQVNRQGNDIGRQYRSAIFYHNEEQKKVAEASKAHQNSLEIYGGKKIATEIVPAMPFYIAEDYHQNYACQNPGNPYIRNVLVPKLEKLGPTLEGKKKE